MRPAYYFECGPALIDYLQVTFGHSYVIKGSRDFDGAVVNDKNKIGAAPLRERIKEDLAKFDSSPHPFMQYLVGDLRKASNYIDCLYEQNKYNF